MTIKDQIKAAALDVYVVGDATYLVRLDGDVLLAALFIQPEKHTLWRNTDVPGSKAAADELVEQQALMGRYQL